MKPKISHANMAVGFLTIFLSFLTVFLTLVPLPPPRFLTMWVTLFGMT